MKINIKTDDHADFKIPIASNQEKILKNPPQLILMDSSKINIKIEFDQTAARLIKNKSIFSIKVNFLFIFA